MNNTTLSALEKDVSVLGVVAEMSGSVFIVLEHVFAVFLISKCRNVQSSVKILVTNLCIIDIIAGAWGCSRGYLRLNLAMQKMLCMFDVLITTCIFTVSALLVSAIALDRYVSVFLPMRYTQIVTKRLIVIICTTLWTFAAVIAVLTLSIEFSFEEERGCEVRMSQVEVFPWIVVFIRLICICIIVFSYGQMYRKIVSFGKIYNAEIKNKELRSIVKILFIVTPHLLLHIIYISIFFLKPVLNIKSALVIESVMTAVVILIDSFIYVFRFKECRLNITIYLCYCVKEFRNKQLKKRTLLYGTYLDKCKSSSIPRPIIRNKSVN